MDKYKYPETFLPGQAIEQERRFSQTLPVLNLDPVIVDRIVELALEVEKNGGELVHGVHLRFRGLTYD